MRITFVSPPPNMTGGFRVIVIYAQQLMRMGHTVRIVSPPLQMSSLQKKLKSWLKGGGWPSNSIAPRSHLEGSGVAHRFLDRWRPVTDADVPDADIVIATWWETAEWVNELSQSKGAKVYLIQHHEVFPHLEVRRSAATYRMPLHKIVVARWLKEVMRDQYGDDVVDVVPNAVDHRQFFASPRGKQTIPTVGLLYHTSRDKGLDVSLSALQIARERIPRIHVVSFGSERLTEKFRLPPGAEFYFCPPQENIRALYSQCDVWITASRTEGFNLPAMEAMACRAPVVSTRAGWPEEEVITGVNGVLVDVEDYEAFAKGIEWVLSRSDADWRKLSENAYKTVASASWEASAKMFETALEHACRRSASSQIAGRCASIPKTKSLLL